jgi:AcrR family transcriptional regulator
MSHRHSPSDAPDLTAPPPLADDPVLAAARDVLMTHGPRRATLAEVARQAGVSRMTVYRRFDTFDRLISALLTVELAHVIRAADQPRDTGSARERAVALVAGLTRGIAQHPLVQRVLLVDPESMVPLMVSRYGQTQTAAMELLAPRLAEGMAGHGGDGSIRDADPDTLAQTVVTAAQAFVFAARAIDALPHGEDVWRNWPEMVSGLLAPSTSPGGHA